LYFNINGQKPNGFLPKTSFGLAAERLSCALPRVPHYGKREERGKQERRGGKKRRGKSKRVRGEENFSSPLRGEERRARIKERERAREKERKRERERENFPSSLGWGLCDRLCLVLVCGGRYGLGGGFFSSFWIEFGRSRTVLVWDGPRRVWLVPGGDTGVCG